MVIQGLDYSYSHPNLECVKQSGYDFVARYIGDLDPNSAKYLDAAELNLILSAGLSVVVVRETTAGFMINDDGAVHARISREHCNRLGLFGIPIYYALDVDPRGLSGQQRANVNRFLAQAAAVDGGRNNVGIYGSDDALDWFVGPSCRWGWQTYAWSTGRISSNAHFRQYRNGVTLCGGQVDLNETYYDDFGQWPRPESNDLTPEERAWLQNIHTKLTGSASGDRIGDLWNQGVGNWEKLLEIRAAIGDVDEAEIAAQILGILTPEAIAAAIPDAIASQVADELHNRLSG